MPQALARLRQVVALEPSIFQQNRLLSRDEMKTGEVGPIFYVENQEVYEWAYGEGNDPVVWGRYTDGLAGAASGDDWQAEREPLSRFLLQAVFLEALLTAHGANGLLPWPEVVKALAPLQLLSLGPWRWPNEPSWFYAGVDLMATVAPVPEGGNRGPSDMHWVWISGPTSESIAYLDAIIGPPADGDAWQHYSRWPTPSS